MTIPRIIHQTAASLESLAPDIRANVSRLQQLNPGWEYRFYSDAEMSAYLEAHLTSEQFALCRDVNPRYGVVLADLFRYVVVHREGGVYLDIKSGLTRPLDAILKPTDQFILSQWRNRLGESHRGFGFHEELGKIPGGEFQQWHVISAPGHPFLARVIDRVFDNMRSYEAIRDGIGKRGVLRLSGPISYTLAIMPVLKQYQCRLVDSHAEGLVYTIYPWMRHVKRTPGHYSLSRQPLMLSA
jgi:inositol phosphorylceramide mannosyltransferase catalytic subunit